MSALDRSDLMDAVVAALQTIAPTRVVTRTFRDFNARPMADLAAGVFTVLFGGVASYPYEAASIDVLPGDTGNAATKHAELTISIIGQVQLANNVTGFALDMAELEMLDEIEQLASAVLEDIRTVALYPQSAVLSQQAESPFAWVATQWRCIPFD